MTTPKLNQPELECWQNAGYSRISLNKFDSRGNIIREQVQAKRKVFVTPEERRMNQEMAASDQMDFFTNGMLVPVRLLDSEADTETLQANVNAMSESHMKALFKSQPAAFKAKLQEISNVLTLNRLLEVASEVDASIRQVEAIQGRIDAVNPSRVVEVGAQVVGGNGAIGTKAPESPRPTNGRSDRSVTGRAVSPK